jgi:uncharacterized membrane protein
MAAPFGTALACGALAVWALLAWDERFAPYLLVGSILLTTAYHVPRNESMATVEPHGADAKSHGGRYLSGWTTWNHIRAVAFLAAAATLIIALLVG